MKQINARHLNRTLIGLLKMSSIKKPEWKSHHASQSGGQNIWPTSTARRRTGTPNMKSQKNTKDWRVLKGRVKKSNGLPESNNNMNTTGINLDIHKNHWLLNKNGKGRRTWRVQSLEMKLLKNGGLRRKREKNTDRNWGKEWTQFNFLR
jgi:hypothetical protein